MLGKSQLAVIVIGVEYVDQCEMNSARAKHQPLGTPGGALLRALRERAGKTQLWVETEAELGSGYLYRVESGKVVQPERETVEHVLNVLGARYSEGREILERYGYAVAAPVPGEDDYAWAVSVSQRELHDAPFPAYLLDCTTRLITWNRHFNSMLGVRSTDSLLERLRQQTMLEFWFDPRSPLGRMVVEADVFLPSMIRALRYELGQYPAEKWPGSLLDQLRSTLPIFRRYWDLTAHEIEPASATRALQPVRLATLFAGELQFRISTEVLTRDTRFRLVYFIPADNQTLCQCALWVDKTV